MQSNRAYSSVNFADTSRRSAIAASEE